MEDLAEVTDWHSLGLKLGLRPSQLDKIVQEVPPGDGFVERVKSRVLDMWMRGKTDTPSWRDVVTALHKMGDMRTADRMREKHSGSMEATGHCFTMFAMCS